MPGAAIAATTSASAEASATTAATAATASTTATATILAVAAARAVGTAVLPLERTRRRSELTGRLRGDAAIGNGRGRQSFIAGLGER